MKIISWNVNGIRSTHGFIDNIHRLDPDIVCLQEIKADATQLPQLAGYQLFVNSANKKGYSGVVIYTRIKPLSSRTDLGLTQFDDEGRFIELTYNNWTLINIYIPHGGRDKSKLDYKLEVYQRLQTQLKELKDDKVIIVGDFNVAHNDIDVCRAKQNHKNTMFTDIERTQINNIIQFGFIDAFRLLHDEANNFTWWPYAYEARKRNIGWRIDYTFINNFKFELIGAKILNQITGSDHCPIEIELDIDRYNKK